MSETLLRTRLYVPSLRPSLVSRPLLVARLNQGLALGHKLSLVSAPAGYGTTTLIAEWIHDARSKAQHPEFAWLSLDEEHNTGEVIDVKWKEQEIPCYVKSRPHASSPNQLKPRLAPRHAKG